MHYKKTLKKKKKNKKKKSKKGGFILPSSNSEKIKEVIRNAITDCIDNINKNDTIKISEDKKTEIINKIMEKVDKPIVKFSSKIKNIEDTGKVMGVEEIVGLIPIPELPDLINFFIDAGYEGDKSVHAIFHFREIIETTISQLNEINPKLGPEFISKLGFLGKILRLKIPKETVNTAKQKFSNITSQFKNTANNFTQSTIGSKFLTTPLSSSQSKSAVAQPKSPVAQSKPKTPAAQSKRIVAQPKSPVAQPKPKRIAAQPKPKRIVAQPKPKSPVAQTKPKR